MRKRTPRLWSAEGRRQFKEQTGLELPREPERNPVLAKQLADAALFDGAALANLLNIVERARAVLTPAEHRILRSFVVRGIEAPKQLRALLRTTEPGRNGALAQRDRKNAQLVADVDRRARRNRCSIREACQYLADNSRGTYSSNGTSVSGAALERRYYRAKGLQS